MSLPGRDGQRVPGDLILFGASPHPVGVYQGAGFMIDAPETGEHIKIQRLSDDGHFAIAVRLRLARALIGRVRGLGSWR